MARTRLYPPSVDPGFAVLPPQPDGWTRMRFHDVVESVERPIKLEPKQRYKLVNAKRSRGGIALRGEMLGEEVLTKTQFVAKSGDFLISRRQIIHGACGVVPDELDGAVVSNEYSTLRTRPNLDMKFLEHYSHTAYFQRTCFHSSHGVDVEKMIFKLDEWLQREVDVPPFAEQKKIAAILCSIDEAIESTQAVIDQLDVVKKAMMAELLTRGIPGRHSRFKVIEDLQVPQTWDAKACGELFDVQLGKMMSDAARHGPEQRPYLRNENVYWHQLELGDVATMHFDERERAKFRLRSGDLLACEGRHIGRCAVWSGELDECYYQKALHRLRSRTDAITTVYMEHFMMLRFQLMTDLVAEANATSTIPHLPREKLVALPVWFPPRDEQDEIVDALTAIRSAGRRAGEHVASLSDLKAALSAVLLTGELRVKPDEASPA